MPSAGRPFAEPVWEEEGSGEDITYTPTAPGSAHDAEFTPSTILTGAHRIKENTSPLYLGDMTSVGGGVAYVRAVIKNVNIVDGEVVQGSGTTHVSSGWVPVYCCELTWFESEDGEVIDTVAMYYPDNGTDRGDPKWLVHDPLLHMVLAAEGDLDPGEADTMSFSSNWGRADLTETSQNSLIFCDEQTAITVEVVDIFSPANDGRNRWAVEVTIPAEGLTDEEALVEEIHPSSGLFARVSHYLVLHFQDDLDAGAVDAIYFGFVRSPGGEPYLSGFLSETGADSKHFTYGQLRLSLSIDSYTGMSSAVVDTMHVSLEYLGETLADTDVCLVLTETTADSRVFVTNQITGSGDLDRFDRSPITLFKVVLRRFPSVIGTGIPLSVWTLVTSTSQTAICDTGPTFRTGFNVSVYPDSPSLPTFPGIVSFLSVETQPLYQSYADGSSGAEPEKDHVFRGSIAADSDPVLRRSWPSFYSKYLYYLRHNKSVGKIVAKAAPMSFVGASYARETGDDFNYAAADTGANLQTIAEILREKLGFNVIRDKSFCAVNFKGQIMAMQWGIFYLDSHGKVKQNAPDGNVRSDNDKSFDGYHMRVWRGGRRNMVVRHTDIPSISTFAASGYFVEGMPHVALWYSTACYSGQPSEDSDRYLSQGHQWAIRLHCIRYVGMCREGQMGSDPAKSGKNDDAHHQAIEFFNSLDGEAGFSTAFSSADDFLTYHRPVTDNPTAKTYNNDLYFFFGNLFWHPDDWDPIFDAKK